MTDHLAETVNLAVTRQDMDAIIAALTVAADRAHEAFRPTLVRVYEAIGETPPADYARGDQVLICTDNGSWIDATVLGVNEHGVRVAYQHSSPSGPYTTTLTRDAVRRS